MQFKSPAIALAVIACLHVTQEVTYPLGHPRSDIMGRLQMIIFHILFKLARSYNLESIFFFSDILFMWQFMRSVLKSNLSRCTEVGVKLESQEDTTLLFESRFESGNLAKAVQV